MKTRGGGWTVFQHRRNGSLDFYRGWRDYKLVSSAGGRFTVRFVIISINYLYWWWGTGQKTLKTIQRWFGMERRGRPASLWSQVTCGCCIWLPSCFLPPLVLLHLLLLQAPVILPHTCTRAHIQTHVTYFKDPSSTTVCIHLQAHNSFFAKENKCGDSSKHKMEIIELDPRDYKVAPVYLSKRKERKTYVCNSLGLCQIRCTTNARG